jgi:cellobiose-specific phosphotransferase system component IIB
MGTKLTVKESAASGADEEKSTIIKASGDTEVVKDILGREIRTRLPDILEEYELMAAIGANEAANPVTASMARMTLYVAQIDDVVIVVPKTRMQMRAVLKQLGNEGIQVLMPVAVKHQSKFSVDEELLKNF